MFNKVRANGYCVGWKSQDLDNAVTENNLASQISKISDCQTDLSSECTN